MKSGATSFSIPTSLPRDASFYIIGLALLLVIVSDFFSIRDLWLSGIIAALLPFVFTYATGLLFMRICGLKLFYAHGVLFRIVSFSLIGLTINASVFLLLGLARLLTSPILIGYFISILIAYIILRNRSINGSRAQINNNHSLQSVISVVAISFFSIGVAVWFQPPYSFPSMAGWDIYTHMLTTRTILVQHGISELNLVYLPVIHYFYAAGSILTSTDPFLLYWSSIYFIFPIGGISLYFLGFRLSNNRLIGISTGVFGITIGSTNEALGFIFPYSSTYGLIIVILANTIFLSRPHKAFYVIYLISTGLVYYPALVANLIIFIGALLHETKRAIYYTVIAITVLVFVVGLFFGGSILGQGGVRLSSEQMWRIIDSSYVGQRGLILVLLGCLFLAYKRANSRKIILVGISTITIFLVMISGLFVSAYRLEEFARPYVAFIMGFGVGSVSTLIAELIQQLRAARRKN